VTQHTDVLVIGGGIMGLAFAWEAARGGRSVTLLERSDAARGASIRNFGMIWPVGQPAGELHAIAMRSRSRWLELRDAGVVWTRECGSLHVVFEGDEAAVLAEFAERAPAAGVPCELLPGSEAVRRFPAVAPDAAAVLWSPTELVVDPPRAIAALTRWLREAHGVDVRFSTTVVGIEMPRVVTARGERFEAPLVIVCGGADFETLFPDLWDASGTRRCKLQMLRTRPQPSGWRLGPALAGGLTMRFYSSFAACASIDALRRRFDETMADYGRWGIHVMASQTADGAITLGDSHEYGLSLSIFNKEEIDELILAYLRRFAIFPEMRIAERWHGIYAKHPGKPYCVFQPEPRVRIVTGLGGAGMTLSFGLAETLYEA